MTYNSSVLFFGPIHNILLTEAAHEKCNFSDLPVLTLKFTNSGYSNFAPLFSVTKDNSTVFFFCSNLIYLGKTSPSR